MDEMERVNGSQCRELERLATAAASMNYTESPTSLVIQNSLNSQHALLGESSQSTCLNNTGHSAVPTTSSTPIPPVISYIEPYQIPKGHQFIPIRTYESQQQPYIENHAQGNLQAIPNTRLVMVTTNPHYTTNNMQISRPVSHFTVSGIQFQNGQVEVLSDNVSPSSPQPQILEEPANHMLQYPSEEPQHSQENPPPPAYVDSFDCQTKKENSLLSRKAKTNGKRKIQKCTNFEEEMKVPLAVADSSGRKLFPCTICEEQLESETLWKQHCTEHNMPKRNGLALELKIEIIKRINSGEKKVDMAAEYGVNHSTIKSIMKKSDCYLSCWKKGLFNPDSKRLKGPKREDVEQALYSWYKLAMEQETPISGPILCSKAIDFAQKLGHSDFKATHGWLDRFKKRNKIVFGRGGSKRKREENVLHETKAHECQGHLLSQVLVDYEPTDIFAVEHTGLFYRSLPSQVASLKGLRCAGGVKARDRLTLVFCTNMTGSEKFPLLVVGKCEKVIGQRNTKTLPVHYIINESSWLTPEIFTSWLLDMDSWFVQQGRKVVLIAPPSPIYSHPPKLRTIKFIVTPPRYPSPLKQLAIVSLKKHYRKGFLEELLIAASKERDCPKSHIPPLSIYCCLQLLAAAWHSLSESVIIGSFHRSGLTKYGVWGMVVPTDNVTIVGAQELFLNVIQVLKDLPTVETTFEDYVHFDDDLQVCNLMGDDDILAKVTGLVDEELRSEDEEESKENRVIEGKGDEARLNFSHLEAALGVLRKYIQYQEGAQEMFRVLAHLEYFIYKEIPEVPISN